MRFFPGLPAVMIAFALVCGCGGERDADLAEILSSPNQFIGSEKCGSCHLEHYRSWKATMHHRAGAFVDKEWRNLAAGLNPARIRSDLQRKEPGLKLAPEQIAVPREWTVKLIMGGIWKQMYVVEDKGVWFVSPITFDLERGLFVNYRETEWNKRPWFEKCAGCHVTGADPDKKSFVEPGVGCEACHGPGSRHAAVPDSMILEKSRTIVNPGGLPPSKAAQVCGACHSRGESVKRKDADWPVGFVPGAGLGEYFKLSSYDSGDKEHFLAQGFSKGHHQQYNDWLESEHRKQGAACLSCHYVHRLGPAASGFQTRGAGSAQCAACHRLENPKRAHSIHSFGQCVGCHMAPLAESEESGPAHAHSFKILLPLETLTDPAVPNSCQSCHRHKGRDAESLQKRYDQISGGVRPAPLAKPGRGDKAE